jgi:hypothetical protein
VRSPQACSAAPDRERIIQGKAPRLCGAFSCAHYLTILLPGCGEAAARSEEHDRSGFVAVSGDDFALYRGY